MQCCCSSSLDLPRGHKPTASQESNTLSTMSEVSCVTTVSEVSEVGERLGEVGERLGDFREEEERGSMYRSGSEETVDTVVAVNTAGAARNARKLAPGGLENRCVPGVGCQVPGVGCQVPGVRCQVPYPKMKDGRKFTAHLSSTGNNTRKLLPNGNSVFAC